MPKYRAGTDSSKQAHKRRSKAKKNAADKLNTSRNKALKSVAGRNAHPVVNPVLRTKRDAKVRNATIKAFDKSTRSQAGRLRVEGNMSEAEYMKKSR